uniref:Calponin-homology (CH) domain-containing protein n=1 Tax=Heterorhabditis bacteriophora TaxID=37862 RepID=A0A1I7XSH2_HETBA
MGQIFLTIDSINITENKVDSGLALGMEVRGLNRPESVIQLARRFGEIGAAQHNSMHKSRSSMLVGKENTKGMGISKSGPCTPVKMVHSNSDRLVGGIASLRTTTRAAPICRAFLISQFGATFEKLSNGQRLVLLQLLELFCVSPLRQWPSVGCRQSLRDVCDPPHLQDARLRHETFETNVELYNVNVVNFSSSWADGMAFCALIHRFVPDAFDFTQLDPSNKRYNLELAFRVAEENGVCQLLEVDDMIMMGDRPDWKCVFTYVQCFYKQFRERV